MASNLNITKLENEVDEGDQLEAGQLEEEPSTTTELEAPTSSTTQLSRSKFYVREADIKTAVGDGPELIGDLSKPYVLPCLLEGTRHNDLKTITSDTLAHLIQGKFVKQLGPGGAFQVIDCRYPYEFDGGHISGAKNLYTTEQILKAFPPLEEEEVEEGEVEAPESPRRLYVFHCEFSSDRAPKLMRFLRNHDRHQNAGKYPRLDYPELYLLHQGYSAFYGAHVDLCEPRRYVRMLSPTHKDDYRQCRSKVTSDQEPTAESDTPEDE